MKELELSIENKAKTYDANYKTYTELINRLEDAKDAIKKQNYGIAMDVMCKPYPAFQITAFSELKDNDDEKIRKALLKIIADIDGGFPFEKYGIQKKEARAWLEKQGENEDKDIETKLSHAHFEGEIEGRDKVLSNPEKYGLQKTVEKVEPKFHEGDWVFIEEVEGYKNGPFQIKTVDSFGYGFEEYHTIPFMYENLISKWTIQDAKNGDVLATNSWLYIFKYTNNKALIQFHCNCPINGEPLKYCFLSGDSYLDIYIDANIHPATKEQRDLLFQKMHDKGYYWDAEHKELKMIEQTQVIDYSDSIKDNWELIHEFVTKFGRIPKDEDELNALIEYVLKRQKFTWSEEDEKMLTSIIARLHSHPYVDLVEYSKEYNWLYYALKSIRPQTTWKPSEEQLIQLSNASNGLYYNCETLLSLLEQLKKLREE